MSKPSEPTKQIETTLPNGQKAISDIITSDRTRSGIPFDVLHQIQGPQEGKITADIPSAERYSFRYQPEQLRDFDEAAQKVQPLLDNEDIGGAVEKLRDVK